MAEGWTVPRAGNSPEDEARAKEHERCLNAGKIRPSWWTSRDEAELAGKTDAEWLAETVGADG